MGITLTSIMVDDQDKALRFYTEILGFRKKHDIPVGEYQWITVISPEGPDDLELALEPNANPTGKKWVGELNTVVINAAGTPDFGIRFGSHLATTQA